MESLFKTLSKKLSARYNTEQPDTNNISLNNLDPRTLKPIIEVVSQSDEFIVTIDNSLSVNWMANEGYKGYAKDFSAVTLKVQLLSAQIDQLFANKANRYKYKKIIAEALALALDEKESYKALTLLKEVESRIHEHGKERVRVAYIFYASLTTCLITILIGIFVHYKNRGWLFGGNIGLYQICIATLMGGIGAFISTFFRFRNYEGNITSGLSAHRLDGFLRILYGCIAALILGLAIYSNTILGFLNTAANQWVIYFLTAIAGISEFLVPNIIRSTVTENYETTSMFKEKEVRGDISKNIPREEKIMNYENLDDEESNEILHQQNEAHNKILEGADAELMEEMMTYQNKANIENNKTPDQPDKIQEEDFNLNRSPEKITMTYEDAEVRESYEVLRQENEEPYEEEADKNTLIDESSMIYTSRPQQQSNETLNPEIEQSNKSQEDIKIMRQMVQGKMDLQDY